MGVDLMKGVTFQLTINLLSPSNSTQKDNKSTLIKLLKHFNQTSKQDTINQQDQIAPNSSNKFLQQPYRLNYGDTSQNSFPKKDPINKFIDDLIKGEEISIKIETRSINMQLALNQECEVRHLRAMDLMCFNGNPMFWPEFIDNFYQIVHSKITFSDNIRMTRLISLLDGDAKRTIQLTGWSDLFYLSALKTLKRDFGNPLSVATSRIKILFDNSQINGRDHNALREFHQQLKMSNTRLMSIGYETPLLSTENLTKTLMRLLYNLHQ